MKCRECSNRMFLDDCDIIRKGNYDNYWVCTVCNTSCIEHIRCNIAISESWHSENNNIVKDYIVKN